MTKYDYESPMGVKPMDAKRKAEAIVNCLDEYLTAMLSAKTGEYLTPRQHIARNFLVVALEVAFEEAAKH